MTVRGIAAQLVCAFLLSAVSVNSLADLQSAIEQCRAHLPVEEDPADAFVGAECPNVLAAIESSAWGKSLRSDWQEEFSYSELGQLEYFVSYYGQRSSGGSELSLASLDAIVLGLNDPVEVKEDQSLWDRFVDWFNELLSSNTDYSPGWLSEWLSNVEVSSLAIEILFWALSALVIIAAISVIVAEVKAARTTLPAAAKKRKTSGGETADVDHYVLTLKDIDSADLNEKPSLLLRLVLQRLESLGLIAYNPARTHREVVLATRALDSDGSVVVSRVSESAEQIRFSNAEKQPQEIADVVSAGIILLGKLKPGQP